MKKNILKICLFILFPLCVFAGGKKDTIESENVVIQEMSKPSYKKQIPQGSPVEFTEVWGYVMKNRENEFDRFSPVTDVGYFAGEVNTYGELVGVPDRAILNDFNGRVHLVVVCESLSLTHLVLNPSYNVRKKLIEQIIEASSTYDGIQIDFELIPGRNAEHFITFLQELSKLAKENDKIFSVCVPARVKTIPEEEQCGSARGTLC